MEVPAPPAVLQPLPELSLVPPADTPEAAFDLIAAANPQPEATLELDSTPEAAFDMIAAANHQPDAPPELDSTPDPETEQPAAAADPEDAATDELEENVDSVLPGEEEIPLEEVHLHCCTCS